MHIQNHFICETSVDSSTIREYLEFPISYTSSSIIVGPTTDFIIALHFVRCSLIFSKGLECVAAVFSSSLKWSIDAIAVCLATNTASLMSNIFDVLEIGTTPEIKRNYIFIYICFRYIYK